MQQDYQINFMRKAFEPNNIVELNLFMEGLRGKKMRQKVFMACASKVFAKAAASGDIELLKWIIDNGTHLRSQHIEYNDYEAFRQAITNSIQNKKCLEVLELLLKTIMPKKKIILLQHRNYGFFRQLARDSNIEGLEVIFKHLIRSQKKEAFKAAHFEIFHSAVNRGDIEVINWVLRNGPDFKARFSLSQEELTAFNNAASHGHIHVMDSLLREFPQTKNKMLESSSFEAFRRACANKHWSAFNWMLSQIPEKHYEIIKAKDYAIINMALQTGHTDFIESCIKNIPELKKDIETSAYPLIEQASQLNEPEVLQWVIAQMTDEKMNQLPLKGELLNIINFLINTNPEMKNHFMQRAYSEGARIYTHAAISGDLALMRWISELHPEIIGQRERFEAFTQSLTVGQVEAMNWLCIQDPAIKSQFIPNQKGQLWDIVIQSGNAMTIHWLLEMPEVFEYAETLNSEHLREFTKKKMANLSPSDEQGSKILYYIIRHYIRDNTLESDNNFERLLTIPSVASMVLEHQNDLLKLAIEAHNTDVINKISNDILNSWEPAKALGYIPSQSLEMRDIASFHESAMQALSPIESAQLEDAKKYYHPQIEFLGGVELVLDDFKKILKSRYEKAGVQLKTGDGRELQLPFGQEELKLFLKQFSADTIERAYQVYYQNKDHTVYRYLESDAAVPARSLIALLFLAVTDEDIPVIDGFNAEGRLSHFIDEIAHIARAHNWGAERYNESTGQYEEYDDLKFDSPSCPDGVNKRLLQSVIAHPLFQILSEDMVRAYYLLPMVKKSFESKITHENAEQLLSALNSFVEEIEPSKKNVAILSHLNITPKEQDDFIEQMKTQFSSSFRTPFLSQSLRRQFALDSKKNETHAMKFCSYVPLRKILESVISEKRQNKSLSIQELRQRRLLRFQPTREPLKAELHPAKRS